MFPGLTQNDCRCSRLDYSELLTNLFLCCSFGKEATNLKDLLHIQLAAIRRMPALLDHIGMIILHCAEPKMCGINTRRIVARVTNEQAVRYGAIMKGVGVAMRWGINLILCPKSTIASTNCALPFPTVIRAALVNVLPKSLFGSEARSVAMSSNIGRRASLDVSPLGSCDYGNGRQFTATAHAQADWIGIGKTIAHAVAMPAHKAIGLSSDNAPLAICLSGYRSFLATTAVAVSIGNVLRGIMGSHQKSPFWCHAAGRFQSSLRLFAYSFTPSLYHMRET